MERDQILAIDNGTQSVRALVFDLKGQILAKRKIEIEPYFSERPGWAEQHPEVFWSSLCKACQSLWREEAVCKDAIAGVAVTTQRATMINLDRNGEPLRPAIVWLDQRRAETKTNVSPLWKLLFRAIGMSETIASFFAQAECNWIKQNQPEIWDKTAKYLLLSGYLTYKLCGRYADSVGCQVGYLPFDYKKHAWAPKLDWKWQGLPITLDQLPELEPPGAVLGQITKTASEETGIPKGLPLVAAAADKACEVLGAGCVSPEIGCLSYGTTATINSTHHRYVEAIPLVPPYPAALPGAYSLEVQIYRGYWMVSWFKQEFGHRERRIAEDRGVSPEDLFDELVRQVPPGSMGLVLQPYWSPGIKIPGPEAKGAVIGFGDVHTRAHLYRAILEGIAYALREGKERTERRCGLRMSSLRVAGGGSQSDAALQLTADVFGLPTSRPHTYEASGLGAAIDAAVGLKLHPDFDTAMKEMTRLGETFEPDPQSQQIYDALYRRVYRQMYRKLRPLYEEIREITGYPPRVGS